jgi:hypothetical protein
MSEQIRTRRWPRRLLVLIALVGIVALVRDRQISRNEQRFGAVPHGSVRP